MAWDGESIHHRYCLLANSRGESIEADVRLSTLECLAFLTPKQQATNIWFSMNYDINHIVWDFDRAQRDSFFAGDETFYGEYSLQYFKRKLLVIKARGRSWKHYDVSGFFQTSFVNVVQQMLDDVPQLLTQGKSRRATFSRSERSFIHEYNSLECDLLVKVMDKLALALKFEVMGKEIHMRSWHGAGAVADAMLTRVQSVKQNVKHQSSLSMRLNNAGLHGYYGGRIELLKVGHVGSVYSYDINSAYPAAMCHLPDLRTIKERIHTKKHVRQAIEDEGYTGLIKVSWDVRLSDLDSYAGPFPWRARDGSILFPALGRGWYWAHEVASAMRSPFGRYLKFEDSITWRNTVLTDFADEVRHIYAERSRLKREGDLRQIGLKLALNSSYGKFAQGVGRKKFFVPLWAGFITAYTRAKLYDAYLTSPDTCVGFATDSIYSTKPLSVELSKTLGAWEGHHYTDSVFIMPGLAMLTDDESKTEHKIRGFSGVNLQHALDQIDRKREATVNTQMFVGHSLADISPTRYGPYRGHVVGADESTCNVKTLKPFGSMKRRYLWTKGKMSRSVWDSRLPLLKGEGGSDELIESHPMRKLESEIREIPDDI